MQVFDRVFASGSVETLLMLGSITLLFLVLGYSRPAACLPAISRSAGAKPEAPCRPTMCGMPDDVYDAVLDAAIALVDGGLLSLQPLRWACRVSIRLFASE